MSIAPFEEDFPAECSPRSLKLRPCFTAFETLRIMDVVGPSPVCLCALCSPRIIRVISSSIEKDPSMLCFGSPALLSAGDIPPSDPFASLLSAELTDSFARCALIDASGGGGGALGAVKLSAALPCAGFGLLEDRGGGASKLCRIACGDSTLLGPPSSRDCVLFASTKLAELVDSCRPCTLCAFLTDEGAVGSVGDGCLTL